VSTNREGSPESSIMCRIDATLHSQNKGSDSFSSRAKVEDHTSATNEGGGQNLLGPFNDQWTSTTDAGTHRRNSFIHRPGIVANATIIWTNQGINGSVRAMAPEGREIRRDCKEGTTCRGNM
jgi:hypothetical protein